VKDAEVFETASGLAVVTTDTESVRVAARGQRRATNRSKRQRAAQRRTGGSTGKAVWLARAKEGAALRRQRDPELRAKMGAKLDRTSK
jgi:hypothetical protein